MPEHVRRAVITSIGLSPAQAGQVTARLITTQHLLAYIDHRLSDGVTLATINRELAALKRMGEVLRLRWEQVDPSEGLLHLELGTTKSGRGRLIPLPVEVCHYRGERLAWIQKKLWDKISSGSGSTTNSSTTSADRDSQHGETRDF
jgi:integrase